MVIRRRLLQRFQPAELQLFSAKEMTPRAYERYCELSIGLFQAIDQLPEPGRAMMLREFWWSTLPSTPSQ